MRKGPNIYVSLLILIISCTIFVCSLYNYSLSGTSSDSTLVDVTIEKGSLSSIANTLEENNLIRNTTTFLIYVYLTGNTNLYAATYQLSEDMGVREIVSILSSNVGINTDNISITFNEGINMREVASIIEENTNNSKDDVYNLILDTDYLEGLIDEYWFVTSDILNSKIYYAIEGYLYPDTYSFSSEDVSVEEIFGVMLDEMENKLEDYKDDILDDDMSIHELFTLASIVELEGSTLEDRKIIAGVFYNRLRVGMSLGSDVTTYYGARVDMSERDLYSSEVSECNDYNTRCSTFTTLPVGPICNFSISSVEAVVNPSDNDYFYFVADINKKIYYSKTKDEHNNTIQTLKNNGLWYEY